MTLEERIEDYKKNNRQLTVEEVSEVTGFTKDTIRRGIIDGIYKFGDCIRKGRNSYHISSVKFALWLEDV